MVKKIGGFILPISMLTKSRIFCILYLSLVEKQETSLVKLFKSKGEYYGLKRSVSSAESSL